MGEEGFGGVEACADVEAGGVVEEVEQDLFVFVAGQEGVWGGVVLPEGGIVAGLPAFDRFGRRFEAGVGGEMVLKRPTTDAGACGLEVQPAVEFAGNGAVGGVWF